MVVLVLVRMNLIRRRSFDAGRFIGQRKERVALGAGELAAALFSREKSDETARKQETEEDGYRDDGHGVVCLETSIGEIAPGDCACLAKSFLHFAQLMRRPVSA